MRPAATGGRALLRRNPREVRLSFWDSGQFGRGSVRRDCPVGELSALSCSVSAGQMAMDRC